ncbi:ABC-2 type transporter-domain-containing protein [Clohesyomyces aquaticus]|uniref:ABC-2 type transporter-domain-containing protein n=1 Tax=Clohesyomyces aquaticus TaxID=1231657 RepID=A0A1Y1ZKI5_9PLEO|nr:ABC-2 type transporter-domain-containing protein [Clohesyomyces aquaticus]
MHDTSATIREAFEFSALLRQPSHFSRKEKVEYVESVLEILDLKELEHAIIDPGMGVELLKRVTIGVELAARPKIIFADEPTSGLDSQGAANIFNYLKRLSREGQAVLVTVHQPSVSLFRTFDKVLALSSLGEQVYFGSTNDTLPYFRDKGADPPSNVNPAEFVLGTVGAGFDGKKAGTTSDWPENWGQSREAQQLQDEIKQLRAEDTHGDELQTTHTFNSSTPLQIELVTKRMLLNQWRKPAYIYSKIWVHIIQAILIGFTFFNLGTSPVDLQSRAFGAFALIFLVNTIVNPILARFFGNRLLWNTREGPSRSYGWVALCTSFILAEIPAIILTGSVYFLLWYFLTGLPLGESAIFTFIMVMTYEVFEMTFQLVQRCRGSLFSDPGCLEILGLIIAADANIRVQCDDDDLFRFLPPPGQTCGSYAGEWAQSAHANLINPEAISESLVCPYTSGR